MEHEEGISTHFRHKSPHKHRWHPGVLCDQSGLEVSVFKTEDMQLDSGKLTATGMGF